MTIEVEPRSAKEVTTEMAKAPKPGKSHYSRNLPLKP